HFAGGHSRAGEGEESGPTQKAQRKDGEDHQAEPNRSAFIRPILQRRRLDEGRAAREQAARHRAAPRGMAPTCVELRRFEMSWIAPVPMPCSLRRSMISSRGPYSSLMLFRRRMSLSAYLMRPGRCVIKITVAFCAFSSPKARTSAISPSESRLALGSSRRTNDGLP